MDLSARTTDLRHPRLAIARKVIGAGLGQATFQQRATMGDP
jgi:hypothetical protein